MAATKRFTDKPLSVNATPDIRSRIKTVAKQDGVSENSVARWLWDNPVTLDELAGLLPEGRLDDGSRRFRVSRDA